MKDFAERIRNERAAGFNRPLFPSQHETVNARYPGCTLEYCADCGEPTGRAGRADDSLYIDDNGPYCEDCFIAANEGGGE